ncbi:unnamed protein product [Cyclocybe aegerita]|uniref:Uncharacterized protein n=1 Tax=Cyclocybe aegerita TaxID=1973307 RepID=A0A8S0W7X1_CYCAE|nr:unnamed protein product [Cyclocybe aegerita]
MLNKTIAAGASKPVGLVPVTSNDIHQLKTSLAAGLDSLTVLFNAQQQDNFVHLGDSVKSPSIFRTPTPSEPSPSPPSLPLPNVSIPDLGHGHGAWRHALSQWMEVDPVTGYALKDWPPDWYTGSMWTVMVMVYKEYERLELDKVRFIQEYPEADKSLTNLVNLIRRQNKKTWTSKNGSPEQWDSPSLIN